MTKVLITGAYGQLGSEIKSASPEFSNLSFIYTDVDSLDITDPLAVEFYINEKNPDFVVNCAAYTAVDRAETDQEISSLINSVAPGLLAMAAAKAGAKMIHISTDYVYGGMSSVPYTEADDVNPLNVYGQTKLDGERACMLHNPESVIIRTSWLYSSYGKNFVKTILRLGKEGNPLKVVFDQTGSPTFAGDLALAILDIINKSVNKPDSFVPGIYNYSNEGVCSWYDFAIAILETSGLNCRVNPVETKDFPTPAVRPRYSVLNKSKIKDIFGIEIPYWRGSLKKCIGQLINPI